MRNLFNALPTCLVVNDLSAVGRCSLTVAIPVLAAMNVQAIPLPTALFSNHLGFSSDWRMDLAEQMQPMMDAWDKNGVAFDLIYSGFLGTALHVTGVEEAAARYATSETIILVDPAMADEGELYRSCTADLVSAMRHLLSKATLTTPNYTEACFLTEMTYHEVASPEGLPVLAGKLASLGPKAGVITSVPLAGGRLANYVYDHGGAEGTWYECEKLQTPTMGTGDLFASVVAGALLGGIALQEATALAGQFVERSIRGMLAAGTDPRYGVPFETQLPYLWRNLTHAKQ